jgi:hypothetical protein
MAEGFAFPAVNVTSSQTWNGALHGLVDAGSDGIVQLTVGGAEYLGGGDALAGARSPPHSAPEHSGASASRGATGPPMSTGSRTTAYSSRACASPSSASPIERATVVDGAALVPPDVPGAIGRLVYPGRPGAVVRLTTGAACAPGETVEVIGRGRDQGAGQGPHGRVVQIKARGSPCPLRRSSS